MDVFLSDEWIYMLPSLGGGGSDGDESPSGGRGLVEDVLFKHFLSVFNLQKVFALSLPRLLDGEVQK